MTNRCVHGTKLVEGQAFILMTCDPPKIELHWKPELKPRMCPVFHDIRNNMAFLRSAFLARLSF